MSGPRRRRGSTSTACSTTRGPGSSCAAAPAGWARPPPRPRSACGPPSGAARGRADRRPGPPARPVHGPVQAGQHAAAGAAARGPAADGGSLHAMMLDMKRTFDEIVEAHSDPDRAAQILANPFYQSLSSSFAGTQEYMAMEKLGQLRRTEQWDLIVVDTPPSRSALDFLDAPQRLSRFLDGRLIKLLTAPTRAGGRAYLKVVNAGFGMLTSVDHEGDRRPGAARRADVRGRVRHDVRRVPGAGRGHLPAAADARHRVPGGGDPGTGRAAGGVVLRGAAVPGPDAAGGPDPQPRARLSGGAAVGRPQPGRGRGPAARRAARRRMRPQRAGTVPACRRPTPPGTRSWWPRSGCTRSGCSSSPRSGAWRSGSPRLTRGSR